MGDPDEVCQAGEDIRSGLLVAPTLVPKPATCPVAHVLLYFCTLFLPVFQQEGPRINEVEAEGHNAG